MINIAPSLDLHRRPELAQTLVMATFNIYLPRVWCPSMDVCAFRLQTQLQRVVSQSPENASQTTNNPMLVAQSQHSSRGSRFLHRQSGSFASLLAASGVKHPVQSHLSSGLRPEISARFPCWQFSIGQATIAGAKAVLC